MKYFDVEAVLPLYFADQEKSYVDYIYLHDATYKHTVANLDLFARRMYII